MVSRLEGGEGEIFVFHPKKSSPPLVGGEREGREGEVSLEDEEVDDDEVDEGEEVELRFVYFPFYLSSF